MNKINYNRPARHRKYIDEGKMTISESDELIREWKESQTINEMVKDLGSKIVENTNKWEDLHGYQDDVGNWEV